MVEMLKLRANYKENIRALQSALPNSDEELLGPIHEKEINQYLHRQEIQNGLTNLRTAYEFIGLRRGEQIPLNWLEDLTEIERQIFIRYYEKKQGYTEIAQKLQLDPENIKKCFRSSLQRVMKKAGRE